MKRFLSILFSLALVIGLMPGLALADNTSGNASSSGNAEQITEDGGNNPSDGNWYTGEGGGHVKVSKVAEPTGIENYFDITLTVEAQEVIKDTSTAVIIVMDASNTMNYDHAGRHPGTAGYAGPRLNDAKAAANQFIEEFCEGEGLSADRRIGVITFNTNAQWASGLSLQKADPSKTSALKGSVNAITAPGAESNNRFTNMEAGLTLAYNTLKTVDVANKYVIFLTDGFPTTYIRSNAGSTTAINGWDPNEEEDYNARKIGTDGYFADSEIKKVCKYGTSYSDKAAQRAQDIAKTMKTSGNINIFSVGIDIGSQTISQYIGHAGADFSVVDRTGTKYVIGDPDNASAYANWLGTSIAGGPKLTSTSHRYADGDNAREIETAFDNILSDIKAISSLPMTNAYVTDPMGNQVQFQYLYDINGKPATKLEGGSLPNAENTASYSSNTDSISWNIMESGLKSIERDQVTGARTVKYSLKYRVRLENEPSAYTNGTVILTNNGASFHYQSLNPDGSSTHNSPLAFPDPEVKGYKGSFSFTKVAEDGSALSGAVFELKHADNCSECTAAADSGDSHHKGASISPMYATSGTDGIVSFSGIPSGHDYILLENNAPIDYQFDSTEYSVNVAYGSTTVKKGNDTLYSLADNISSNDSFSITNKRLLPCEVEFVVSKHLHYGAADGSAAETITPEHEMFEFTLTELEKDSNGFFAVKDKGYSETIHNHGTAAEFTTIHFESTGSYYYKISETINPALFNSWLTRCRANVI